MTFQEKKNIKIILKTDEGVIFFSFDLIEGFINVKLLRCEFKQVYYHCLQ